ncbi:uncharacterized protein LOC100824087 [Brachypodium distachyon]|uniref:Uncharacterized protein n=1 Tax=Brachypodium distachyon TaxID=15368 RepID=I1IEP0_BRADI|nr:uncharacterized protein LOC100824087 [Brachypodium distachyon]KQK01674.1 hypothetical protein BRADI_3g57460v3 [Brachypodium distachyon]|eukprot:XP_003570536.1 uncharacterized protein LOC100824087 [Brachypodium distachyon]
MEGMMTFITPELRDVLVKVAAFLLVQGLVYLILSKSSNLFSKDEKLRSQSFRKMRTMSVRRLLGPLFDVPLDTDESSPSPSSLRSWSSRRWANRED